MPNAIPLVTFRLNEQRYAVRLEAVERIVTVVDITPLPKAPDMVLGVINVSGRIVPVVDPRVPLRLPRATARLSDLLIIVRAAQQRTIALLVEAVDGVLEAPQALIMEAEQLLPGLPAVMGVVKLPDGLIVIHALDHLFTVDEAQALDTALSNT